MRMVDDVTTCASAAARSALRKGTNIIVNHIWLDINLTTTTTITFFTLHLFAAAKHTPAFSIAVSVHTHHR
jgi:hypothetical protein